MALTDTIGDMISRIINGQMRLLNCREIPSSNFRRNILKNLKRIKLAKKYANKRAALKKIIKNKKLELSERFAAQLKLNKLPKNSSKIRIRNRCEVSGRPHGVYRKLRISRIALRDMASSGKIPGITKSSW